MQVHLKPARLIGGLTLLALCGCHTYSPYGPYGSGSGYGYPPPGTYSAPPSGYAPGGTVVPGTVVPNRSGGTISPGQSGFGAPGPGPGPSANGQSPTFEAKRGTSGLLPNEKPVPDPKTPETSGFSADPVSPAKSSSTGSGTPGGAFAPTGGQGGAKPAGSSSAFPGEPSPFNSSTSTGSPAAGSGSIKLTGSEGGEPQQEPARFQQPKESEAIPLQPAPVKPAAAGGSSTTIDPNAVPMSNATGGPNPYDFDRKSYTWLRGKVDYDEGTKSWQIIYSLDGKDKFGGSLTLSDDPKLKKLRNDDVVLVEGRVDATRKTNRGKPVYKIDHLFGPLVPKTKVSSLTTPGSEGRSDVATNAR